MKRLGAIAGATLILAVALLVALDPASVKAAPAIIYVDRSNVSGPWDGSQIHPFRRIQEAIDAANPGDTVSVAAGIYPESVTVRKSLTLRGEGRGTTIIDGRGAASVVEVTARNVTVSGFTIERGTVGVNVTSSVQSTISDNTITYNTQFGVFLFDSIGGFVSGNTVSDNGARGIYLRFSYQIVVDGNTVSGHSEFGVYAYCSSQCNITNNKVSENSQYGIQVRDCRPPYGSITISGNTVSNNPGTGIYVHYSSQTVLSGNMVSKNGGRGIYLFYSPSVLRNNNMTGNRYNLGVEGRDPPDFIQDVDATNTVDGRPVCYWVNQHNGRVPKDAGYVAVVGSTGVTVEGLSLVNNDRGVLFVNTSNSTVVNVNASNNGIGISLLKSSNNRVIRNTVANNSKGVELSGDPLAPEKNYGNILTGNTLANDSIGLVFTWPCSGNTIFHNNFIDNERQVSDSSGSPSINTWDDGYSSGGNYWSDYNGADLYSGPGQNETGGDGIGDTPYVIDPNNRDNYPLMSPWSPHGPVARFTFSPPTPLVGGAVTFDASLSMPGFNRTRDVPIANYTWDFGDGNVTTVIESTITHAYPSRNSYTVNLTVTCEDDPVLITEGLTSNSKWQGISISETTGGEAKSNLPVITAIVSAAGVATAATIYFAKMRKRRR